MKSIIINCFFMFIVGIILAYSIYMICEEGTNSTST